MIYAQNINCNFLWDDIHVYILHHITLDRGMDQNLLYLLCRDKHPWFWPIAFEYGY